MRFSERRAALWKISRWFAMRKKTNRIARGNSEWKLLSTSRFNPLESFRSTDPSLENILVRFARSWGVNASEEKMINKKAGWKKCYKYICACFMWERVRWLLSFQACLCKRMDMLTWTWKKNNGKLLRFNVWLKKLFKILYLHVYVFNFKFDLI